MKKLFNSAFLITLVLSAFLITSCGEEKAEVGSIPIKVNTETVKKANVAQQLEYPGTVEGESKVKLSTKLMGEITYFPFEAGTKVTKNQLLAKINGGDIAAKQQQVEANIHQAEAAFKNVEINYNRVKSLFEKNSATKKELEDIQLAYDMAKAQLSAAKEMKNEVENVLDYSEIRAPFDGYIVNKFFEEGDIAAPGHPLMIVESFKDFKVTALVPASDINLFNIGQEVAVSVDAARNKLYKGKVAEVNPGGNSFSKQFEIKVKIENNQESADLIKSGMYASIVLTDQTKPLITVDESVLVKRGQLVGVYSVSDNNEALLRWLRLGKNINGKYEVPSGLTEGDIIITDKEKMIDLEVAGENAWDEFKDGAEDAWEDVRDGTEKAWKAFSEGLKKAAKRFK